MSDHLTTEKLRSIIGAHHDGVCRFCARGEGFTLDLACQLLATMLRDEQRRRALERMLYEATHASPREEDGSHWCKISAEAIQQARLAYWQTPDGKRLTAEQANE